VEILKQAVELDPSNAQAQVALGATLALSGDRDGGIARMRHGIKLSPRDRRLAFWGWALGGFLLRAKRPAHAREALNGHRSARTYGVARQREGSRQNSIGGAGVNLFSRRYTRAREIYLNFLVSDLPVNVALSSFLDVNTRAREFYHNFLVSDLPVNASRA
jgi:hypothetical protein